MVDRKILAILVLLAGYVILIRPLVQKAEPGWSQINIIRKSIAKESFIAKQEKEIKKNYPIYQKIVMKNEALFFPSNTSLTTDRSKLQQELKKILQRSGLTIVKINWGEVLKKQGYKKLPISFVARGTPIQLENLFRKIQNSGKLIKFEQITITKYRKEGLLIDAIVTGFKKEESSDVKG